MRLLYIAIALAAFVIAVFVVWGGGFESWLSGEGAVRWVEAQGAWGWAAVIGLLISDLFLPVPATAVMSAAGFVYGWLAGGLMSAAGSFLAGALAYGMCRASGEKTARWLAGGEDLEKATGLFQRHGAWIVAASRSFPVLPEVVACLAGLARMPARQFFPALACGSLPLGFIYAAIGASGHDRPGLALGLSAAVPVVLWLVVQRVLSGKNGG